MKRIVNVNVLKGEPTDGSGRVCIHFLVRDTAGPFIEPHVLHPGEGKGKLIAKPTRCRLACDPKRGVAPITKNGVTTVTPRTEHIKAVTCTKCKKSAEYADAIKILEE
jgi:hypothetical protein